MPYVKIHRREWWLYMWRSGDYCGIFRNRAGVKPGRWGFYILGLEIGSRNPGDRVGVWLRSVGIWPW